jgi:hypothetical protein
MRFQLRVIAVTLAILITTLVLNSVLSLASFEKLYLNSLVSTLELAGKNLKRKIEQALRFGKPFENFKGLDSLLAEVLRDNPEISSVGVSNTRGMVLYHTDEAMIGSELPQPLAAFERGGTAARTQLVKETYITSIPLLDRSEAPVGIIHLSFPRSVITQRLQQMATENARVLWIVVLLTSIGLIVGMTLWVTRPMRSKIIEISGRLILTPGPPVVDELPDSEEGALAKAKESLTEPWKPNLQEETVLLQSDFLEIETIKNELRQLERTVNAMVSHCHMILHQHHALQEEELSVAAVAERLGMSATAIRQLVEQSQAPFSESERWHLTQILQENDLLIKELRSIVQNCEGTYS